MSEVYKQKIKEEEKKVEPMEAHDIRLGLSDDYGLLKLACKTHGGEKRDDCEAAMKVICKEIAFQLGIKSWSEP